MQVRWIIKDADLSQAKSLMAQHHISALLVDTGTPVPGFITKRDFLKVSFSKNLKRTRVRDIMTQPVGRWCQPLLVAVDPLGCLNHEPSKAGEGPMAAMTLRTSLTPHLMLALQGSASSWLLHMQPNQPTKQTNTQNKRNATKQAPLTCVVFVYAGDQRGSGRVPAGDSQAD